MQSGTSKEEYNKKLDEIIEFFKIEKETWTFYLYMGKEDSKFSYNVVLSTIVILLAVSATLLNTNTEYEKFLSRIIIVASMLFLGLYMFIDLRSSKKMNKRILNETIKFNHIINSIQSLKTLPYEVDLSKLVEKIKHRYLLLDIYTMNDEKYIAETYFIEILHCLDEISKEIREKERINSLQK